MINLNGWHLDGRWWIGPDGERLRAISGGGPGGKTVVESKTTIPPKTEEELQLLRKQTSLLDIQVEQVKRQNEAFAELFPQQKELFRVQTEAAIGLAEFQKQELVRLGPIAEKLAGVSLEEAGVSLERTKLSLELTKKAIAELEGTPEEQELRKQELETRKLSNARVLAILRGEAPPLLPGQQERIETVFRRAGEEAQAGLRTFGEELAASRGMRVSDSPIGGELLRQGRELASSLAAAKAGAELNVGQTEQQFAEAVRQFQENLRQRGVENRMALTGMALSGPRATLPVSGMPVSGATPQFAPGMAGQSFSSITPLVDVFSRERVAGAKTIGTQTYTPGFFDYFSAITQMVGAAAGAYAKTGSSERFKRDIEPLDVDEYERARLKVKEVPVVRFAYKWDGPEERKHLGIVIETSPEEVSRDGLTLDMPGYVGLTLAALKGVDRRVDRLEARLPIPHPSRRGARLPIPARAA